MLEDYIPYVRKIAHGVVKHSNFKADFDDVFQDGFIGLMQAHETYKPEQGRFDSWAFSRIKGAMIDGLRERSLLSRDYARNVREINAAEDRARQQLQREPESEDIARAMGLSLESYQLLVSRVWAEWPENIDDYDPSVESSVLNRIIVHDVVDKLPDIERYVVQRHVFMEHEQAEIANTLGVHKSRVSQILTAAKKRLRRKLIGCSRCIAP